MKSRKKKMIKIALLITIIIVLFFPVRFSYSKTDDTFQYSSILFSYERLLIGTKEPKPVSKNNVTNYSVVNYDIKTKVRILFLTVYDHTTKYEAWVHAN